MKEKKKVLVIDDDPTMIRLMEKYLQVDGYKVSGALSGKSGLEKARIEKPDLILLDVVMPEIDGKNVVRQLKSDSLTSSIPILFMTVTIPIEKDKGEEVVEVDGVPYRGFAKPLHSRKLLSVIRKVINAKANNNPPPVPS